MLREGFDRHRHILIKEICFNRNEHHGADRELPARSVVFLCFHKIICMKEDENEKEQKEDI